MPKFTPIDNQPGLSRRSFLRLSALTLCSGLLAGCLAARKSDANGTPQNYYVEKRSDILAETDQMLTFYESACAEISGPGEAVAIVTETRRRFETLLQELPYIGGGRNELTQNLYQSALALGLYRTMQARAQGVEETGRILYFAVRKMMYSNPMAGSNTRTFFSETTLENLNAEAERSQNRTYPEDWVFDFIPGDGKSFDYGIDYTECGICKYFKAQGAAELTPYLCLLDFPISEALNTGLIRTNTLAHGGSCCDFRFKFDRPTQREWTPAFLEMESK